MKHLSSHDRIYGDMPAWSTSAGRWGVVRGGRFIPLRDVESVKSVPHASVSGGTQTDDPQDSQENTFGTTPQRHVRER